MSRLPSWVWDHPEVWTSPYRQGGDPCVRGTRTNASIILDYINVGATDSEILEDFPWIRPNQIEALRTANEHHTKETPMTGRMSPGEAYALIYGKYPMETDSDPMVGPYNEAMGWVVQMGPDSYTNDMPDAPYEDAKMLAHAERALRTIVAVGKVVDYIEKSHPEMTREQYVRSDTADREVNNVAQEILWRLKDALGDTE